MRYLRLDTWGCQAGVRYINATWDALAQCKTMRYLRLDTWGCQAGMRYINALQNSKQDPYGLVGEGMGGGVHAPNYMTGFFFGNINDRYKDQS